MSQQDILKLFSNNKNLLSKDVAKRLGISTTAVIRSMGKLNKQNVIRFDLVKINTSRHRVRVYNLNTFKKKKK